MLHLRDRQMRWITELFCFCACLKFATIKQILTFVSMNWSRENQVIHSRHLHQINSRSTNLTGYCLWGTSETCVCRLSGEVWVQGVQTATLCALFLNIMRDQRSRLEQAWEIPVQQGGSSKGTQGAEALPQDADMVPWCPVQNGQPDSLAVRRCIPTVPSTTLSGPHRPEGTSSLHLGRH